MEHLKVFTEHFAPFLFAPLGCVEKVNCLLFFLSLWNYSLKKWKIRWRASSSNILKTAKNKSNSEWSTVCEFHGIYFLALFADYLVLLCRVTGEPNFVDQLYLYVHAVWSWCDADRVLAILLHQKRSPPQRLRMLKSLKSSGWKPASKHSAGSQSGLLTAAAVTAVTGRHSQWLVCGRYNLSQSGQVIPHHTTKHLISVSGRHGVSRVAVDVQSVHPEKSALQHYAADWLARTAGTPKK